MKAKLLLLILLATALLPAAMAQPALDRHGNETGRAAALRQAAPLRAESVPGAAPADAAGAIAELLETASSAPRGFFASQERLSYNAAIAVDPAGGVHLAFYFSDERHQHNPLGQPAFYTYCPPTADCTDPSKYNGLVQLSSTQVSEVQVAATSDGRPRLLVRRNGSRGNDYHYWSCDEDCLDAANWVGLFAAEGMGAEVSGADLPQHSFALDAQDRPRFVYSNGWGNGRPNGIYYAYCDAADCTEPGSWQETTVSFPVEFKTVTSDYAALVFDGTKPRVLTRYKESGLPVRLEYYACDAGCGERSGWARTILTHPESKQWANWDLALGPDGQPRIALYEAAGIDIRVGGKLFYGWCEADCNDVNATFRIVQVAAGEGKNVDLTIDAAGRTYLVYDAGQRGVLGALTCDGDCTEPASWKRQILQTSEELQQEFAPASPFNCAQNEEQGRAWLDAVPKTAFDREGRLVVAYDVKNVAICYYTNPQNPNEPVWTKVERLWWAVRVGFYTLGTAPAEPAAQLSADRLTFPTVTPGLTADRTVTLTNISATRSLTGSVGAAAAPFTVVSGGGAFTLAPGQSRTVTVRFAPTAAGTFEGYLYVTVTSID